MKFLWIREKSHRGQIIRQGVEPDVDDMFFVRGDGDAPVEGSAGNTEVVEALTDEIDHLVSPGCGLNKVRMAFDMRQQLVGVVGHLEEIGLFGYFFHRSAAVRALAVFQLMFGPVGFAGGTVKALVFPFIDVPFFVNAPEDLLHDLYVAIFGGADEVVVTDGEALPELLESGDDGIHILERGDAFFCRGALNFLPVFITAGKKKDIVSRQPLKAGDGIGDGGTVSVADVQLSAGIVDGGSYIERFFLHDARVLLLPVLL